MTANESAMFSEFLLENHDVSTPPLQNFATSAGIWERMEFSRRKEGGLIVQRNIPFS
jgi:hypothetical protein